MEVIKKIIRQAITTGTTAECTGGTCYVIIPDLTVVYNFNFSITQENKDLGFFDVYEEEVEVVIPVTTTTTTTTTLPPTETFYALDDDGDIFLDDNNDKFEWI
jgi:hypothetical protein